MTADIATALLKQLTRLSAGSCSCGVKSPDIQWHDAGCRYRLAEEIRENVEALEEQRAEQWRLRREAESSRDVARAACDSMRIERDAALTATQSAPGVSEARVKPLEWREPSKSTNGCWTAESALGVYSVCIEGDWYAVRDKVPRDFYFEWGGQDISRDTLETAKAAAQADYERRISSALTATQSAPAKSAMLDLLRYVTGQDEVSAIDTYNEWATDRHGMYGEYTPITVAGSTAQSAPAPGGWRPTHRHLKSGHLVREIGRGFAQVSIHPIEEMTAVSIYEHDGHLWVRNAVEFDDGRFEELPTASPAPEPVADAVVERVASAIEKAMKPGGVADKTNSLYGYYGKIARAAIAALAQPAPAAQEASDTHDFKNFHRLLCERFGYTHDEKDWRRDQVSLIEWIAKRHAPAAQEAPSGVVEPVWLQNTMSMIATSELFTPEMRRRCAEEIARLATLAERQPQPQEWNRVGWIGPDAFERLMRGDSPRETVHAVTNWPNSVALFAAAPLPSQKEGE